MILEAPPPLEKTEAVNEIGGKEMMDILEEVLLPKELENLSLEEVRDLFKVLNDSSAKNGLDPRKIFDDVFKQESQNSG